MAPVAHLRPSTRIPAPSRLPRASVSRDFGAGAPSAASMFQSTVPKYELGRQKCTAAHRVASDSTKHCYSSEYRAAPWVTKLHTETSQRNHQRRQTPAPQTAPRCVRSGPLPGRAQGTGVHVQSPAEGGQSSLRSPPCSRPHCLLACASPPHRSETASKARFREAPGPSREPPEGTRVPAPPHRAARPSPAVSRSKFHCGYDDSLLFRYCT